jgi:alginate O-acetyltransferase complex protein AlgI
MVFSSIIFLVYFLPFFLIIYFITPRKQKNLVILLSSIFFYAWGAPRFIFVIMLTTLIDFFLVNWMDKIEKRWKRRFLLCVSLIVNCGLLFYFKYANFFIDNLNHLLGESAAIPLLHIVLPIGISFYTFETITYVVDVYRRVHKPLNNFWDYQLYIILFPKLIAGPIIRYHEIADQIDPANRSESAAYRLSGLFRFIIGLGKKVLIANSIATYADAAFNAQTELNAVTAWTGILAYTFQIYFDFSGYSDMAIGLGKIMGFRFPENFNNPYVSRSITEFWRRWHITLGAWMRNYLYIPLGGNKVTTKRRLYFNLWIVFLASGFWHGASWNFIIWGAYHGLFLILERAGLLKFYERIGKIPSLLITFLLVLHGWVFFRAEKLEDAIQYLQSMYGFFPASESIFIEPRIITMLIVAFVFSLFTISKSGEKIHNEIYNTTPSTRKMISLTFLMAVLYIFSLSFVAASGYNPFIYFRF